MQKTETWNLITGDSETAQFTFRKGSCLCICF